MSEKHSMKRQYDLQGAIFDLRLAVWSAFIRSPVGRAIARFVYRLNDRAAAEQGEPKG